MTTKKIPFTNLKLKTPQSQILPVEFGDFTIDVKCQLSTKERNEFIDFVCSNVIDNSLFLDRLKMEIYFSVGFLKYQTNITFTEKQLEDIGGLYDKVLRNGLLETIMKAINEPQKDPEGNSIGEIGPAGAELNTTYAICLDTIKAYYDYKNSFAGMAATASVDAENIENQMSAISEQLSNPEDLKLLKDVINKMA